MGKVRGIRFSDLEESQIDEFLKNNPVIDFSTLAKIAILEFIKDPHILLVPNKKLIGKEVKNVRSVSNN